jgi:hypothetical protein
MLDILRPSCSIAYLRASLMHHTRCLEPQPRPQLNIHHELYEGIGRRLTCHVGWGTRLKLSGPIDRWLAVALVLGFEIGRWSSRIIQMEHQEDRLSLGRVPCLYT